jgi:hypothetical protein
VAPSNDSSRKDKKLEGNYANYFAVGHNAHEFIFDFGQHYSEIDQAELITRIITSPTYVKVLVELLHQSITEYEKAYGSIVDDPNQPSGRLNFFYAATHTHINDLLLPANPAESILLNK